MIRSIKVISAILGAVLCLGLGTACGEQVSTSAKACTVIDAATGRILLERHADQPLPMASTTKVMTALLALERGDLSAPVTCSRTAFGVPGTSIYLSQGETLTLEQMLYGLMLASGNDAAVAIAEHIGGSCEAFCSMMTERAAQLGCTGTVFLTPHGLPKEGHVTTARDLALIAREAMRYPFFRQLVSTRRATIPWPGRSYDRVLNNKNRLLADYPGCTGIKTGYTRAAGRCLVFGARRDGLEVIGVVLNCADWFDEAARLLDLTFERYEAATLLESGAVLRRIPVEGGDADGVEAILGGTLTAAVPKNALPQLQLELPETVQAPVTAGACLGWASMCWQGETLCSVPIIAGAEVCRGDLPARLERVADGWLLLP